MTSTTTLLAGGRPGDFLTARHVRVAGSQREIGRSLAAAAHAVHGAAAEPRPADPRIEGARRDWFARHHPLQLERMAGVADHFGADPDDTSVSFDWLGSYELPAGCSVAFFPGHGTKDGHGILARNFDFPTATLTGLLGLPPLDGERPLGADPWVIESRPDTGYASVTVGIMDVLGAMDGVNEAGLTVALLADNESPDPEPTGAPRVGLAEQQVVRYLLDRCATVEEAKRALLVAKHYYFFTPCHYVVADRTGASFVWEHSPRRNHELIIEADPRSSGRLVCTNHLLHRWPDPAHLPDDSGPIGTAALTYHRWRTISASIGDGAVLDRDDILDQLDSVAFRAPVEGARTLWQALYDVEDAAVELSFFTHDADGASRTSAPVTLRAT
ncbi:MAG: C45 family autoproteolytic acyltransferase/hydrolase [Ilumatobacteraceae bacterium]|nr:C45 family autoproteolytic acyltransferase/hydrolase [Ilumatobacteraceae bacterium]